MSENILSKFPKDDKDDPRSGRDYYAAIIAFMVACFLAMLALVWKVSLIPEELELIEVVAEPIEEVIEEPTEEPTEETIEITREYAYAVRRDLTEKIKVVHVTPTDDDIIAAVVMAESGSEDLFGKVLVALSIMNRCDYYGISVEAAVSAPSQYSYPYFGLISHDCYRAVEIARENRDLAPSTMMWFRAKKFHTFATPWCAWGGHCFSYLEVFEDES